MKTSKTTVSDRIKRQGTHNKKGSGLWLLPLLILLFVGGLYLGLKRFKPDWLFLAGEQITKITRHADLTELSEKDLSLETVSLADILVRRDLYAMDSSLLLVNEDHTLAANYAPDLAAYKDTGVEMNPSLTGPYADLAADVKNRFDTSLYIRSSYRNPAEQQAEAEAEPTLAAAVGASEHETGLALDIYVPKFAGAALIKTDAGQYVNRYCWRHGFIIRYPWGKETVTGIPYEPWHLRYVGKPHAEILYKSSLTLEEYIEKLTPGSFYAYEEFLITRQKPENDALAIPEGLRDIHVSPDNSGCYILWGTMDV